MRHDDHLYRRPGHLDAPASLCQRVPESPFSVAGIARPPCPALFTSPRTAEYNGAIEAAATGLEDLQPRGVGPAGLYWTADDLHAARRMANELIYSTARGGRRGWSGSAPSRRPYAGRRVRPSAAGIAQRAIPRTPEARLPFGHGPGRKHWERLFGPMVLSQGTAPWLSALAVASRTGETVRHSSDSHRSPRRQTQPFPSLPRTCPSP